MYQGVKQCPFQSFVYITRMQNEHELILELKVMDIVVTICG